MWETSLEDGKFPFCSLLPAQQLMETHAEHPLFPLPQRGLTFVNFAVFSSPNIYCTPTVCRELLILSFHAPVSQHINVSDSLKAKVFIQRYV